MKRIQALSCTLATLCLALPVAASAQRSGQITFYDQIAFRGSAFTVTGPRENLNLRFNARSARLAPGEAWEICTETRYSGRCQVMRESVGNVALRIRSARPASPATTLPAPAPVAPGNQQSLRGMASEYFPQPSDGRGRVLSCPGGSGSAACAAQNADRFCESRGWTASSHESQETVTGRIYLADVLCTRTG